MYYLVIKVFYVLIIFFLGRRMLESKARLYDRLVQGTSKLTEEEIDMNKHYLVQFDRKDKNDKRHSSDEEHFSDEYEPASNPDEEW